jgi:hypothetical protein
VPAAVASFKLATTQVMHKEKVIVEGGTMTVKNFNLRRMLNAS